MIRCRKIRQDEVRESKEGRRAFRVECQHHCGLHPGWLSMSRKWRARRHEHALLKTDNFGAVRRQTATMYVPRVLMRFSNRFAAVVKTSCIPQEQGSLPSSRAGPKLDLSALKLVAFKQR